MKATNIYLNFDGQTEEALNFYAQALGGKVNEMINASNVPEMSEIPENEKNRIMHASLDLPNGACIMAADMFPSMGYKMTVGSNFQIYLDTESKEEADKFFNALVVGGTAEMAMDNVFWGAYFGSLRDKFGVGWMISYTLPTA